MKRVLYVVEDIDSAQFRYMAENNVEAFKHSKNWRVEYVLKRELRNLDLEKYSLVVIVRQTAKDDAIIRLIKQLHEKGLNVLFDLDDLVFDYRDLRLMYNTVEEKNIFYWMGYFWGIRRIAKRVDGFLCTNDFLGKKLKRSFKKPYRVVLNSLNEKQVKASEKIIKEKKRSKAPFTIGYFSGTKTHLKDFRVAEPELVRFLENHSDAKLRIVGYMDFSDEMKKLIRDGRVEVVSRVDYLELLELVSRVDVNIAPSVINDFTNCKSELKFFEAAIVETSTIASPTYAFKDAITDGDNGFLAKPGEWYSKLEYLYNHPEENKKIAKRARVYSLKRYYGDNYLKETEAAYEYFSK